jgi:hypothetical protein
MQPTIPITTPTPIKIGNIICAAKLAMNENKNNPKPPQIKSCGLDFKFLLLLPPIILISIFEKIFYLTFILYHICTKQKLPRGESL